ncbi:MAG: hypothetical protein WC250_03455 [Candidatus Paceibacterota bacterium]
MFKKENTVIVVLVVVAVISGGLALWFNEISFERGQIACTMEARLCPDGSYVGRVGPKCEFSPCPSSADKETKGWTTFTDPAGAYSFKYPADWPTDYVATVDWPPKVNFISGPFTCTEGGSQIARAGETVKKLIAGREYCITKEVEGAAGTMYIQYVYATEFGDRTAYFTWTMRQPQCLNYDQPRQGECLDEENAFDPDSLMSQIVGTFKLNQ